ncbi:hypothetical protein, partial [Nocardia sp. SC052]|uniref:hypothetical protein n=1 Tax=Nocardia sichangensis TaxID=3385975 RepID=UPI00399FF914
AMESFSALPQFKRALPDRFTPDQRTLFCELFDLATAILVEQQPTAPTEDDASTAHRQAKGANAAAVGTQ